MINNGTQAQGDDGGDASIWTQPRFVASATVVAIIVVLGIVLAVTGRGGDSTAATPAADMPPVAVAPVKGDCDLPAGDQTVPESTPDDTRWELVGKMIAPTAPSTYGPGVVKDGFRTCFAQSPLGALYALRASGPRLRSSRRRTYTVALRQSRQHESARSGTPLARSPG